MRPIRQVAANAVALVVVLGVVFGALIACGSAEQPAPEAPEPAGSSGGMDAVSGQAGGTVAAAGQAAAGIAALGGLGQAHGSVQIIRDLGKRFATDGRALVDRLEAGASGGFAAEPTAEQQAALADLRARTGEQFDQAWLRAAEQTQQQVRAAAKAVLADENVSAEAKAAAKEALRRLDALAKRLRQVAAPAGAGTPRAVHAGSGGQAAGDVTQPALLLAGVGAVLLAGALWWRRRAA